MVTKAGLIFESKSSSLLASGTMILIFGIDLSKDRFIKEGTWVYMVLVDETRVNTKLEN